MSERSMGEAVHGQLFDRKTGQSFSAVIYRDGEILRCVDMLSGKTLKTAFVSDAVLAAQGDDALLKLAPGAIFAAPDTAALDRLVMSPLDGFGRFMQRSVLTFLIGVAVILACAIAMVKVGLPATTRAAVNATPHAAELVIAEGALTSLDSQLLSPTEADEARRIRIAAGFDRLVDAYSRQSFARSEPRFEVLFRKAPAIGPNAIAIPGGQIVVTDELLDLIDDDDQVLAILAHEMAHVHHRHSLFGLYRAAGIGALGSFVLGDLSQLAESAASSGARLTALSASRRMEREADDMSIILSEAAGLDPLLLIRALETLGEDCGECGQSSWFSTHPGIAERRDAITRSATDR